MDEHRVHFCAVKAISCGHGMDFQFQTLFNPTRRMSLKYHENAIIPSNPPITNQTKTMDFKEEVKAMQTFSLNSNVLEDIFRYAKPLGHNEKPASLNLGFGFLYYGVVRTLRPKHIVVIGSGFGFSVVCLALGLKDNHQGRLTFVDPSYSLFRDGPFKTVGGIGNWGDPARVHEHFKLFEVETIVTHHRKTSAEFFEDYSELQFPPIDVAFIDGSHAYRDVKFDFLHALERSHKNSYIFLHDTHLYVRELLHHAGVKRWLKILKREGMFFEVINFPFSSGVALVRVLQDKVWKYGK
jgi:predicted O-methyltransferase YrrM